MQQRTKPEAEDSFWVFVDIGGERTEFYIAPKWWVENNIYETHHEYLARHGGKRAINQESTHHAILHRHIAEWKDRWDVLGIIPSEPPPEAE